MLTGLYSLKTLYIHTDMPPFLRAMDDSSQEGSRLRTGQLPGELCRMEPSGYHRCWGSFGWLNLPCCNGEPAGLRVKAGAMSIPVKSISAPPGYPLAAPPRLL